MAHPHPDDHGTERGRDARRPTEIDGKGWRDILMRTKTEITVDHVSVVSAGVAFFGLLALFPAIAAVVSIAGLLLDPATMEQQIAGVAAVLPQDAAAILTDQAAKVAANDTAAGWGVALGILLALYGAQKGMKTLIEGMNIAYDETEDRGFVKLYLTSFALTLFLIFGLIVGFGFAIVAPAVAAALSLPGWIEALLTYAVWPLLAVLTVIGLAVLYRFGPSRSPAQWSWLTPGALVATALWIAGSIGFSIYVANFGTYNESYGTLGGVIVLLTWLWLSAFIVLLGAELNSEMEHQTARDTTIGGREPMGHRGAVKADTIGETP
ncbi:MAG: YihY/virulence factor BrkB family protein [Paracoccaceae bacterium]